MYHYKRQDNSQPIMIIMEGVNQDLVSDQQQEFAMASQFKPVAGKKMIIQEGADICYFLGICQEPSLHEWSILAETLPAGNYYIRNEEILDEVMRQDLLLAWGLSQYHYHKFISKPKEIAYLVIPRGKHEQAMNMARALNWGRDLINHPANYLGPEQLEVEARQLARQCSAKFSIIDGNVLKRNYPLVYAVGKAADDAPRMIEFKWIPTKMAKKSLFKLAIVGKGVTFDTGGLDVKSSKGMLLMKKDMGGAAHSLTLARLIMENNLPIQLRVLIPAVENSISSKAFRPMDILTSRQGTTIEIGNTDAEGRLILADALTAASEEMPDLIIDFATLTGAARIATGAELPNLFSNREGLLSAIQSHSLAVRDPVWPMPLFKQYKRYLKSDNADLTNAPSYPYAGSITAALFLEEFINSSIAWVHLDVMAWNLSSLPGKPRGGEIQGVRAIYQFITESVNQGVQINEYETYPKRARS